MCSSGQPTVALRCRVPRALVACSPRRSSKWGKAEAEPCLPALSILFLPLAVCSSARHPWPSSAAARSCVASPSSNTSHPLCSSPCRAVSTTPCSHPHRAPLLRLAARPPVPSSARASGSRGRGLPQPSPARPSSPLASRRPAVPSSTPPKPAVSVVRKEDPCVNRIFVLGPDVKFMTHMNSTK
jgi:hypothetical protein